tara:strand:- start:205 stop:1845 length:1641 start_codon:yes stop_codon:yes gene_type:complete
MKGGKAIASGSAGCVFKPALLCEGDTERKKDFITKVMYSYNAENELREIKMVVDVLKDIPNKEKYFLVNNITKCHPNNMDKDDKKNRQTKCSIAFGKYLSDKQFNDKIKDKQITGINIPYGGKDLNEIVGPNLTNKVFLNINNGIIDLIKNGIIEFNKRKLLHLDVKNLNILYNPKDKNVRLIDWGISSKYTEGIVTEGVKDRNLMFNRPIVSFLFDHHFNSVLKEVLRDIPDLATLTKTQLKDGLTFIFRSFLEPNFKGLKPKPLRAPAPKTFIFNMQDYYIIADFFNAAFENKLIKNKYSTLAKMEEEDLMSQIIRDSLIPVIVEFIDLKTLTINTQKLFDRSYKSNVDIYGALSSYMSYISKFSAKLTLFKKLDNADKLQFEIFNMIMKYMYNPNTGLKSYNIAELITDLQNLNSILLGEPIKRMSSNDSSPVEVKKTKKLVKRISSNESSPIKVKNTNKLVNRISSNESSPIKVTKTKRLVKKPRCKKGTVRNKLTGKCEPKNPVKTLNKSNTPKPINKPKIRKRCPNGTKRDKKTDECVPK